MAANTGSSGNKRTATRHIRDGIKSNYKKDTKCACCSVESDLELHHYTTVSILLKNYSKTHGVPIDTDEQVLEMREQFYEDNWVDLVEYTVTLCSKHHSELHRIYGREPTLISAGKQEAWVKKIHGRLHGKEAVPDSGNRFSKFLNTADKSDRFSKLI
jgi:hypothetical protein